MLNTSQNTMQIRTMLITDGMERISELTTTRRPSNREMVLKGRNALRVRIAFIAEKSARPANWATIRITDSLKTKYNFEFWISEFNSIRILTETIRRSRQDQPFLKYSLGPNAINLFVYILNDL